jgi:hypothetical protein
VPEHRRGRRRPKPAVAGSHLGLVPRGGNDATLRRYALELGVDVPPVRCHPLEEVGDELFARIVASSRSIAEVLRELGTGGGAARRRVMVRIERLELDTSHLLGQAANAGRTFVRSRLRLEDLADGRPRSGSIIRRVLVRTGAREHRCGRCDRETWEDAPIPREVDHVDGDRRDDDLSNLRLLCPSNCHALTPTYRGRNIGRHDRDASSTDYPGERPG